MLGIAKNELMLIYNSDDPLDRKALSYAKSMGTYHIKEFDLQKNSLTETQLQEISQLLHVKPQDLVDTQSGNYPETYFNVKLSDADIRKALSQHPEMTKTPIAVFHNSAEFVNSGYEFIQKSMA